MMVHSGWTAGWSLISVERWEAVEQPTVLRHTGVVVEWDTVLHFEVVWTSILKLI